MINNFTLPDFTQYVHFEVFFPDERVYSNKYYQSIKMSLIIWMNKYSDLRVTAVVLRKPAESL